MNLKEVFADFDLAIANATIAIEKNAVASTSQQQQAPTGNKFALNNFEHYLSRGVALCFNPPKEDRYSDAIKDLTIAFCLKKEGKEEEEAKEGKEETEAKEETEETEAKEETEETEARYYRAYAYFISKEYERAIANCQKLEVRDPALCNELLGNIYFAQRNYEEAEKRFLDAIKETHGSIVPSSLLENYRKACAKARGN